MAETNYRPPDSRPAARSLSLRLPEQPAFTLEKGSSERRPIFQQAEDRLIESVPLVQKKGSGFFKANQVGQRAAFRSPSQYIQPHSNPDYATFNSRQPPVQPLRQTVRLSQGSLSSLQVRSIEPFTERFADSRKNNITFQPLRASQSDGVRQPGASMLAEGWSAFASYPVHQSQPIETRRPMLKTVQWARPASSSFASVPLQKQASLPVESLRANAGQPVHQSQPIEIKPPMLKTVQWARPASSSFASVPLQKQATLPVEPLRVSAGQYRPRAQYRLNSASPPPRQAQRGQVAANYGIGITEPAVRRSYQKRSTLPLLSVTVDPLPRQVQFQPLPSPIQVSQSQQKVLKQFMSPVSQAKEEEELASGRKLPSNLFWVKKQQFWKEKEPTSPSFSMSNKAYCGVRTKREGRAEDRAFPSNQNYRMSISNYSPCFGPSYRGFPKRFF